MRIWKSWKKKSSGNDFLYCDTIEFGAEHNPDIPMQCFCEPKIQEVPTTCANDGENCMCNGLVYYMKNIGKTNNPYDFYDAIKLDYTVNNVNKTGSIKCGKSSFEGVNPLPGEEK